MHRISFHNKWLALALTYGLLGSLSLPVTTLAAEENNGTTLRERFRERLIQARQEKRHSSADESGVIDKPGDYTFSLVHDGLRRKFRVFVPASWKKFAASPLLIAFHGGGGDMDHMANDRLYGLISKAETEGFVVVFPNGYSRLNSGKMATWNAGKCCADARDRQIDDVGFIRQLIEQLSTQLTVDRQRIFAAGMSNGGMMAYRLACEMSDTFAAIAAVAGTDNTLSCPAGKPMSILHIHARNDDHVLYGGGAGQTFRDPAKVTDFTSVPATIAKWVERNHCAPKPKRVLEVAGAYCDLYQSCDQRSEVKSCITEQGGHSWPGGHKPRSEEAPSQAISANEVIWSFFMNISRSTARKD